MVTAGHNHHADNGVKIIEPDGSMLVPEWEPFAELIVNSTDLRESLKNLSSLSIPDLMSAEELFGVSDQLTHESPIIKLAMDTR